MSIRDHLPGAGKRKDAEPPRTFYRSKVCELRDCVCVHNGHHYGKGDIAIQDQNGQPIGYVCQKGYMNRMMALGKDQLACVKVEGIKPPEQPYQTTLNQQANLQRFQEIHLDFDRYVESIHDRENCDERTIDD